MKISLISLLACLTPALASAEVPKVVTDMPVVQSLTAQVMGKLGTPTVLIDKGANPHSYQMKPSQARALQQADLLFWVGPEMTPWLTRAVDAAGANLQQSALLHSQGTTHRTFIDDDDDDDHGGNDNDGHSNGHSDDHDHGHDHDHDDHADHDHSGLDPHAWLDPHNAEVWVDVIATSLAAKDPDNAAVYAENAAQTKARIAKMDQMLTNELTPVKGHAFIVYHAAYGYFSDHYGLSDKGSIAFGDATDPGAAHLSQLRADLNRDNIVCAFPEASHDSRQMEQLIAGTSVRLGAPLDPEGMQGTPGPDLYETLMTTIGKNISACLAQ